MSRVENNKIATEYAGFSGARALSPKCKIHLPYPSDGGGLGRGCLFCELWLIIIKGRNPLAIKKNIPKFKNEDQERRFWAKHDSTEFVDWKKARRMVLPNLKPSHPKP
jgi:hypothetical protein